MANIARTELIVASSDTDYQIPGDMTAAQLVTAYSGQIPGLSNMVSEERIEYREGVGNVRVVTFKPRTGTKGASVARTELIVASSDTDYQIPGDMTASQLVTAYSGQIPGLSNMVSEERIEYREGVGNVRVVTFKPRTGTKGATVARTELIVASSDTDYQIPGDMTASQLITAYAGQIPGLSNMVSEERIEYREGVGNVRVVTFKPRTGTKG